MDRLASSNQIGNQLPRRKLGPVESKKRLTELAKRPLEPELLDGIQLDQREVARMVVEAVRPLRLAAISANLSSVVWLLENTFYEAFNATQKRPEVESSKTCTDCIELKRRQPQLVDR